MAEHSASDGWMQRCILLTPSAQHDAWIERLRDTVSMAGFELLVVHDHNHGPVQGEDRRIVLAADARLLRPTMDALVCVILTDVQTSVRQTTILTGATGLNAVIDASRFLVDAVSWQGARLFTDAEIARNASQVEIFPGIVVQAPPIAGGLEETVVEAEAGRALQIFADGEPPVGAVSEWGLPLFHFDSRRPDRARPEVMDTSGGPRFMAMGPGIALPPGKWQATVRFSVDDAAARHHFRLDWGVFDDMLLHPVVPPGSGIYDLSVSRQIARGDRVELMMVLTEGSMGGTFEFFGAKVERLA